MFLLVVSSALAASIEHTFLTDAGGWVGGEVSEGLLVLTGGSASLNLGGMSSFEAVFRLRLAEGTSLAVSAGEAAWTADYAEGGGLSLGEEAIHHAWGHYAWEPDEEPFLEPGSDFWDGGNTLHCDVYFDEPTATWFLYWTGEMASGYPYRQIGLATSSDGETWTEYAGNPVLTIDYDRTTVDGIHVHMPTVAVDSTDTWHMYYACYQNDVGNRLCHATSADGYTWTPEGVAVDLGGEGEFDEGSLRMPDVLVGDDGTWHLLYNGTDPEQHYGPTGYATSADEGWTWEKLGAITDDESRLQGGGMLRTAYGVEQWWNCDDVFCASVADPADLSVWTDADEVVLDKGWADWSAGYIQAPSMAQVGTTYHMWFNAYGAGEDGTWHERLGHARTVPVAGAWMTLRLRWDGALLTAAVDDGPELSTALSAADGFVVTADGTAEVDEVAISWEAPASDSGETGLEGDSEQRHTGEGSDEPRDSAAESGGGATGGGDSADDPPEGKETRQEVGSCGCGASGASAVGLVVGLLAVFRRSPNPAPASGSRGQDRAR